MWSSLTQALLYDLLHSHCGDIQYDETDLLLNIIKYHKSQPEKKPIILSATWI